jgi:hypothetical protein
MDSTMQDTELLVSDLFEHGRRVHPDAMVFHYDGATHSMLTFAELGVQTARLAGALRASASAPTTWSPRCAGTSPPIWPPTSRYRPWAPYSTP